MPEIAIRDAFGEALHHIGTKNSNVVVLESDVGSSTKSNLFGSAFPDRYFNIGIAELNMTAMATGFVLNGILLLVNILRERQVIG